MAKGVEVYFTGLISLISRNQVKNVKSHAAAIVAADHTIELLVGKPNDPANFTLYPIDAGDHIYLADEGQEGIAGLSTTFSQHLPLLEYLVDGDLRSKVQTTDDAAKAAYLHFLNGLLLPAFAYECGASYELNGNSHSYSCVARLTYLETRVECVSGVIKKRNVQSLSFETDNWILLRNIYVGQQVHNALDHVKFSLNITTGKKYAKVEKTKKCLDQHLSSGQFTEYAIANLGRDMDVDCVGSQWP